MTATSIQRVARLLTLVPWLQRNDGVTLTEAADHFGLTRDELERDLWQVILCGFPGYGPDQLVDIDFWEDDRIHVIEPLALSTPLRLTTQEALSLLVGLSMLKDAPGAGDRELIVETIQEIERALAHTGFTWESAVEANVRELFDLALLNSEAVRFTYRGITSDVVTHRCVVPERIEVRHGHVYVVGWCIDSDDERIFRMDRIFDPVLETLPETSRSAPSVKPMRATRHEAVISGLHESMWLLDRLSVEELTTTSTGWRAHISFSDPRWLTREIMGAGGAAWVESPTELRENVREAAEALLARYAEEVPITK